MSLKLQFIPLHWCYLTCAFSNTIFLEAKQHKLFSILLILRKLVHPVVSLYTAEQIWTNIFLPKC